MVEPQKWYYKATPNTHTHTLTHNDIHNAHRYIEVFFYGLLRVASLGLVRSRVSQFYWFVTLPNHRRKEKSVKKRREKVHEIMEAIAPKSPTQHTIYIFVMYCDTLAMPSAEWGKCSAKKKTNQNVKCQTCPQPSPLLSPPLSLWPFSHVYRYQTSFCFRFASIIIVILLVIFIDCIFALDCLWPVGKWTFAIMNYWDFKIFYQFEMGTIVKYCTMKY